MTGNGTNVRTIAHTKMTRVQSYIFLQIDYGKHNNIFLHMAMVFSHILTLHALPTFGDF